MRQTAMAYVLWDWNGTLLDDTRAALASLNAMLARRKAPPIGMRFYLDNFSFPVRPFYESIGMVLENEDWDALAREYHSLYAQQPKALNREALAALERVRTAGAGQSVISALRQDLLEEALREWGVAEYMEHVYGVDNLDGASKLGRARELMRRLASQGVAAEEVVVIGDALHDLEVAEALGVRAVLCAQGSHAGWRLRRAAPTGETLTEAVELALNPCRPQGCGRFF